MEELVSILIPAFNAERWIRHTIESALAQSWQNKEVIVVDDGSTDGTLAEARRFASPSVKIVTQENRGASAPGLARQASRTREGRATNDATGWASAGNRLRPQGPHARAGGRHRSRHAVGRNAAACAPGREGEVG